MSFGHGTAALLPGSAGWASFGGAWWVGLGPCGGCGHCGARAPLARLIRVMAGLWFLAVEWRFCGRGRFWSVESLRILRKLDENLTIGDPLFLFMFSLVFSKPFVNHGTSHW